jgi:hypothetical protein
MHGLQTALEIRRALALAAGLACAGIITTARGQTTYNGNFNYQDWGGSTHSLADDKGTVYDQNMELGTFTTNAFGAFSVSTDDMNVDGNGNLDFYSIANVSTYGGTAYASPADMAANNPYSIQTPMTPVALNGTGSNTFAIDNTVPGRLFGALQYIDFMDSYYSNPATYDLNLPSISIIYNSGNVGSNMDQAAGIMNLGYTDWGSIDTILHEYGHYVAWQAGMQAAPLGNTHGFNIDNISKANGGFGYGALVGSDLAYQEGIATYLEQVAISDGNLAAAIPGLPADASNYAYDAYNPTTRLVVNPATDTYISASINSLTYTYGTTVPDPDDASGGTKLNPTTIQTRGYGEGDELSVMRALWDFENNTNVEAYARAGQSDQSNYGALKIFGFMSNPVSNKGSFYGFWQTLDSDLATTPADMQYVGLPKTAPTAQGVALLGSTLEQNDIASVPVTTGLVAANMPVIKWNEENNGNSKYFEVLIYSQNWSNLIYQSGQVNDPTAGQNNPVQYATTAVLQNNTFYNYVILSDPSIASNADLGNIYNWYWSGSAQIYVPEPTSLGALGIGSLLLMGRKRRAVAG